MAGVDIAKLAGVRFHAVGKVYHFDATGFPALQKGDFVVVETARGRQIGQVVTLNPPTEKELAESIKPIERAATGRDMAVRRHWQNKEAEAIVLCRQVAARFNLPLKVIGAEYSFDGTRLLFLYTAEDKVDTQGLRQEVGKSFRARVELKLIGPRDVAKLLGGYGACGELRCCSEFLTDFSSISIKMAKEQGISLNPQEITGICGRLRCCLLYEYEQYVHARKSLPKRGKDVGTPHGRGTVVDVLPLKDAALVQVGEHQFEVAQADIMPLEEYEALAQRAAQPCDEPCEQRKRREAAQAEREPRAEPAAPPLQASADKTNAEKGDQSARRRRRRRRRPTGERNNGRSGSVNSGSSR